MSIILIGAYLFAYFAVSALGVSLLGGEPEPSDSALKDVLRVFAGLGIILLAFIPIINFIVLYILTRK